MNKAWRSVVVVGGGLAGIACGTALREAGWRVTLLEARHALGGRASSFIDPQTGEELDNCQHVLLGCYTNLLDLYRRLGVLDRVRWERRVRFVSAQGQRYDLWGVQGMPAPLHMGASMAGFGLLTVRERLAVAQAMFAILRMGKAGREQLDGVSFGQWLQEHRQSAEVVDKFYEPVLISALNEKCRHASAKYAIQVFQDAMLAHEKVYLVGVPACPLGRLVEHVPVDDVRLNCRVDELAFDKGRAVGVRLRNGDMLPADAVVVATNHHALSRWIPEELRQRDARFAGFPMLQSVPILGVHMWFDRPVMHEPSLALVQGALHWLFRKDVEGKVVHGLISAAREWSDVPRETALQRFQEQIQQMLPLAKNAQLLRGVIVHEKRATFSPTPGMDRCRPIQGVPAGGIEGLYLAGDYTQTGWPATMEGAVRGGYLAAQAVSGQTFLLPDLPVQWPARWCGM